MTINTIYVGQRYMSSTEPELGLGIITQFDNKTVSVAFPGGQTERRYAKSSAPIRRVVFQVGDVINTHDGQVLTVRSLIEKDGLIVYQGDQGQIFETQLADNLAFNKPEEKLLGGQVDSLELFRLRVEALRLLKKSENQQTRGLMGARIELIPHQVYIAQKVSKMGIPRVLLSDEVGLGKTIEACLILHKLLLLGRIEKALIVVPRSLLNQWFIELYRRFNLNSKIVDAEEESDLEENPFDEQKILIISLELLTSSPQFLNNAKSVKWDLMIVDEAHRLSWSNTQPGREFVAIEKLATQTPGLILLSATPEQLGQEGHFGRLRLIDPIKFHSYQDYLLEMENFGQIAQLAQNKENIKKIKELLPHLSGEQNDDQLLDKLIDQYGPGRVLFRNTRKKMSSEFKFFPKRKLFSYKIKNESKDPKKLHYSTKLEHLVELLNKFEDDKILLICRSFEQLTIIENYFNEKSTIRFSVFHAKLPVIVRDRHAAYFADPQGAQILVCTEIGSEGRNFQFAKHLILFDLPHNPDLLEQRIGRLDRIGQKFDVHIHVPYFENSAEEILFRWYHEGLQAFEQFINGSQIIFEHFANELESLMKNPQDFSAVQIDDFIKRTKLFYEQINKKLDQGKDALVEINSFNPQKAIELTKEIAQLENEKTLSNFMERVFDQFGVEVEDLDASSLYIRPGDNMYIPSFPTLTAEGVSCTYVRSRALEREDFQFLTWDHPMVTEVLNLLTSQEYGNATAATWKNDKQKGTVIIETIFTPDLVISPRYEPTRFFNFPPIRVFINVKGEDVTNKYKIDEIEAAIVQVEKEQIQQLKQLPREVIKGILNKAKGYAQNKMALKVEASTKEMNQFFMDELKRLEQGHVQKSKLVEFEIAKISEQKVALKEAIEGIKLKLDCLRIIF